MAIIKTSALGLKSDATNLVLLSSVTASNDATISFDSSLITSDYDIYKLRYTNIIPETDGVRLNLSLSTDNGSSYIATGLYRNLISSSSVMTNDSNVSVKTGTSNTEIKLAGEAYAIGGLNKEVTNGYADMYNLSSSTVGKIISIHSAYEASNGHVTQNIGNYEYDATTTVNNIKISCSSGNIESGTITLYGVKT